MWAQYEDKVLHDKMRLRAVELYLASIQNNFPTENHYKTKIGQIKENTLEDNGFSRSISPKKLQKELFYPPCPADKEAINRQSINVININIELINEFINICDSVNDSSNSFRPIDDAEERFNNAPKDIPFVLCDPSFTEYSEAGTRYTDTFNLAVDKRTSALTKILANSERELGNCIGLVPDVKSARSMFENSNTGGGGTKSIISAHEKFDKQRVVVQSFEIHDFDAENRHYSVVEFYKRFHETVKDEAESSVITELDRLRNEYVVKKIPVPAPSDFTKTAHSVKFPFSSLNTGSYTWAVLKTVLLNHLDEIASAMEKAGYQIQLNSVYRNPARSEGKSRHQYGDAVDIQVFDFNKDKKLNEKDWKLLKKITDAFSPSYTEPVDQSGIGHIHVDWRS